MATNQFVDAQNNALPVEAVTALDHILRAEAEIQELIESGIHLNVTNAVNAKNDLRNARMKLREAVCPSPGPEYYANKGIRA